MPSVNKTPNYGLNQWAGNEFAKRQDFVDDNEIIDAALKANADASAPASVRGTILTGLSSATNAVITAGDSILTSLGKLQKQITDHKTDYTSFKDSKGSNNGIASLDADGDVPLLQLGKVPTIPTGVIVMWSGGYTDIPTGWALCNGANGTPDLQDRFVMGSTSEVDHKTTGGANSVSLTEAQLPSHKHDKGTLTNASNGGHSHAASSDTTGSHGHTASSGSAGGHNHLVAAVSGSPAYGVESGTSSSSLFMSGSDSNRMKTNTVGSHTHSVSIGSNGSHSHQITLDAVASHTHAISGSTGSVGSGSAHENRPAFYKLAFIMKL